MTNDETTPDGRMHPLTLTFRDGATEAAFRESYVDATLGHVRRGILLATVSWIVALPVARSLRPDEASFITTLVFAAMVPPQILNLLFTFVRRARPLLQGMAASVNVIAGVGAVLLLDRLGVLDRFGVALLMLQVVFACLALRLRFGYAFLATVLQFALYLWMDRNSGASSPYVAADLFLLLSLGSGALFGSYSLEKNERTLFVQRALIEEQKRGLEQERAKSDRLLLNVLPASIAAQLKEREGAIAEAFPDATILFSDIVGFTPLASKLDPRALVELLDEIFSRFDDLAERHGVEKIKTIGDAYMAVGGVPNRRTDHAAAVARMALEMLGVVKDVGARTGHALGVRIGLHTGPVVAGVIGKKKFTYDLWGDAVNTASRMESHGQEGRVHVSDATATGLADQFMLEARGTITVKGKGEMRTFFLGTEKTAT